MGFSLVFTDAGLMMEGSGVGVEKLLLIILEIVN
jgi:hypothetical protein